MNDAQIDTTVHSFAKSPDQTLVLVLGRPGEAAFVRSATMRRSPFVLGVIWLLLGGGCPVFLTYFRFFDFFDSTWWFLIVFETVCLLLMVLFVVFYLATRPIRFDLGRGRFWREGRPDRVIGRYGLTRDIAAVQICSQEIKGESPWTVYEINLVLARPAGTRFAIVCHGDREVIYRDATKLAEFLEVPLLDHCQAAPG